MKFHKDGTVVPNEVMAVLASAEALAAEVRPARFVNPFKAYRVYKIMKLYDAAKLALARVAE
jgi:hypothetical protein